MLPHPAREAVASSILAALVLEEQADELDRHRGFDFVEDASRVVQRRRLPSATSHEEGKNGVVRACDGRIASDEWRCARGCIRRTYRRGGPRGGGVNWPG